MSNEPTNSESVLLGKALWPLHYARQVGAHRYLLPAPLGWLRKDGQDNWVVTFSLVVCFLMDSRLLWRLVPTLTTMVEKGLLVLAGLLALSVGIPGTGLLKRLVSDDPKAVWRSTFPYLWFLFVGGMAAFFGNIAVPLIGEDATALNSFAYLTIWMLVFGFVSFVDVVLYALRMYMLSLFFLELELEQEQGQEQGQEQEQGTKTSGEEGE